MKKYIALAALMACVPGAALAQDKPASKLDGVRIEARIGYETPTVSDSGTIYKIGSAVSYGGEIGFDLKAGKNVTVGPYAVYEFSSVSLCDSTGCLKEDGNLGAGGRIGFIAGNSTVIYAKVGYGRISFHGTGVLNGFDAHKDGIQGAIGVDVNVAKNVYVMVEGNYADYGKLFGTNLQRRHLAGGVGFRF
jgi:outer membrane immunogenic protein